MSRSLITLLILLYGASVTLGGDRFTECDSTMEEELGWDYTERLLGLFELDPAAVTPSSIHLLVRPSFEPEWLLVLDPETQVASVTTAEANVWYANWVEDEEPGRVWSPTLVEVPVSESRIGLPAAVVERAAEWVSRMERGAGPMGTQERGYDGTVYQLYISAGRCIEVWSPDRGSNANQAVEFFERLRSAIVTDNPVTRTAILKELAEQSHAVRQAG